MGVPHGGRAITSKCDFGLPNIMFFAESINNGRNKAKAMDLQTSKQSRIKKEASKDGEKKYSGRDKGGERMLFRDRGSSFRG